jgi:hypothetical protein
MGLLPRHLNSLHIITSECFGSFLKENCQMAQKAVEINTVRESYSENLLLHQNLKKMLIVTIVSHARISVTVLICFQIAKSRYTRSDFDSDNQFRS